MTDETTETDTIINDSQPKVTLPDAPLLSSSRSDSYSLDTALYIRDNLELFAKTELIDIIIDLQSQLQYHINHHHKKHRQHQKHQQKPPFETRRRRARTLEWNKATITHPHEEKEFKHRQKGRERKGTNWQKIEKQRVAIKALKAHRKKTKGTQSNSIDTETISHPHEKTIKNIKATERNPTNYDLIQRKRADIKALKQERKRDKLLNHNSMKWRREQAHKKMLGLFDHAHEHKYKRKRKQKQPQLTVRRVRIDDELIKANNGKVRIMRDDDVLRFSQEIPIDNFLKAINSGFVKIMNEDEQNEEYFKVTENAKNMMQNVDDLCNYQFVVTEYNFNEESDSDSDWDNTDDDVENEDTETDEYDDDELLQKELLLLSIKSLKRKCKEYRMSAHGGKLELIQKIIQKRKDTDHDEK